jgi:uncharacterized protein YqeY
VSELEKRINEEIEIFKDFQPDELAWRLKARVKAILDETKTDLPTLEKIDPNRAMQAGDLFAKFYVKMKEWSDKWFGAPK